jgi:hypothetical protein
MELSECKDVKEFLELKWRLSIDHCNVCTALMIYLTLLISVASRKKVFEDETN